MRAYRERHRFKDWCLGCLAGDILKVGASRHPKISRDNQEIVEANFVEPTK